MRMHTGGELPLKCCVTQVTSGNRVKKIALSFSPLTGERCYRCRISRQARASVLRRRISRDRTRLTQRRWSCNVHHASRLFEPREKTHHACPHLPEKRIRCRLACRPGHFFSGPCVGVESLPVLLERKHRRDEMRGGKKLEKCNQRDFTFCQVGNLKVHQK